jgi:hypothetical protein
VAKRILTYNEEQGFLLEVSTSNINNVSDGEGVRARLLSEGSSVNVLPETGELRLDGYSPTASVTDNKTVSTELGELAFTGFSPSILTPVSIAAGFGEVSLSGFSPNVNITEGGFDHFTVTNQPTANVSLVSKDEWTIYPNPTSGSLFLKGATSIGDWSIFGANGQMLFQGSTQDAHMQVPVESLQSGMYFLRFQNEVRPWVKQ